MTTAFGLHLHSGSELDLQGSEQTDTNAPRVRKNPSFRGKVPELRTGHKRRDRHPGLQPQFAESLFEGNHAARLVIE